MGTMFFKILALICIFCGEAIAIYAEIISAKHYAASQQFYVIFLKGFLIFIVGAALLIGGYTLGYSAFKNIWIITVFSISAILIVEPFLNYLLLKQLPTRGAFVGLIFGFFGLISSFL